MTNPQTPEMLLTKNDGRPQAHLTPHQIQLMKEELFNQFFEDNISVLDNTKDSQCVYHKIIIKNQALSSHYNKLANKFSFCSNAINFIEEYICSAWQALDKFQIKDNSNWQDIVNGIDKPNIGRIINTIKTTTQHDLYNVCNPDQKRTCRNINGENVHVTIKAEFESLDALLNGELSEVKDLPAEASLFNVESDYQVSYFQQWLRDNKANILTSKQLETLDKLEGAKALEGYTDADYEQIMGAKRGTVRKRLNRISNRIMQAWIEQEQKPKSIQQVNIENTLNLFQQYIDICYSDNLADQNSIATQWIIKHMDNNKILDIVLDALTTDEQLALNRIAIHELNTAIKADALAKILNCIEDKAERLEVERTQIKQAGGAKPLELHTNIELLSNTYIPDTIKTVCYVYNNSNQLLRIEPYQTHEADNRSHILTLLPTGITTSASAV